MIPLLPIPSIMGQMSSIIRFCGDAVRCFRGPNTSNACLGSDTQSHVLPPLILPNFPTEIILTIAQYLPPSSLMSLIHSCRTIHNKMGVSIEHLLGTKNQIAHLSGFSLGKTLPEMVCSADESSDFLINGQTLAPGVNEGARGITWSLPDVTENVYHSERLKLLYMLDRDQKIPPSKAVCTSCADTHDRSLFSTKTLAHPIYERSCLGSVGRVWICPHWMFDCNLVTTSAEPQGLHACGDKGVYVHMVYSDIYHLTPNVRWPIIVLQGNNDAPSKKVVDDILGLMDIPVCKHLRYTDQFVSRLYSPDCKKLRWKKKGPFPYCQCSSCVWQLSQPHLGGYVFGKLKYRDIYTGSKCESCGTDVYFRIEADENGQETLELNVRRNIRMFRGCTDRTWIEQVNDPSEFDELERKWYAATNEICPTAQDTCPA